MFLIAKTVTMRSNQIMLLLINFKRTRICLIICFASTSYTLDTKHHYYFDRCEKRYFHLDNTLSEAKKQIIHQKIDTEISWLKKCSVGNNLILLQSAIFSSGFIVDILRKLSSLRNNDIRIRINKDLAFLTFHSAVLLRAYYFRNTLNYKLTKLSFKQSLLKN